MHWFRHESVNTNVVSLKVHRNLYSNVEYQYDIFSVSHNFVNFYLMLYKTLKTSKWLWCSVATGSIKKNWKKTKKQIYYSAKPASNQPWQTRHSQWSSLLKSTNLLRPPTKGRHWYMVTFIFYNNFPLSGYKVKYKPKNRLYVMALIKKVSV